MRPRGESAGSVEDSGPDRIEIHPGLNLQKQPEFFLPPPFAGEGFMQVTDSFLIPGNAPFCWVAAGWEEVMLLFFICTFPLFVVS